MCLGSSNQEIIDFARTSKDAAGSICSEGEDEENGENGAGVDVVGQEGSLDAAEQSV